VTKGVNRLVPVLVGMVVILALALRLWGINFGLPYPYHIDEHSYVVGTLNLGQGEINGYPQQVGLVNVLFGEYALYFIVGRLTGLFKSTADFSRAYYTDPTVFYLLGRLTSALMGAATCLVIYLLGRELRNRLVGLGAALLIAVNFLHVRESHFTTPDVAQALGFILVLLFALIALRSGRAHWIYLAGFIAGVTVAWKWASLPLALGVAYAAWQLGREDPPRQVLKRLVISGLLMLVGFALFSPQLLLFPAPYIAWAKRDYLEGSIGGYGGFVIDTVPGWQFYLKALALGFGVLGIVLSLAGLAYWAYRAIRLRDRQVTLVLLVAAGYFLLMASSARYFVRYAVPLIPLLALAASDFIYAIVGWTPAANRRFVGAALAALMLIAAIQPVISGVRSNILLTRQDTRTIAKQWMEQNIPAGAKIATDWMIHGVPLATTQVPVPGSAAVYNVTEVNGLGLYDHPLDYYRQEGYDYLVTTSYISDLALVDRQADAQRDEFYRSLDATYEPVKEFRPYNGDARPPFIFDEIYGALVSMWQRELPGPILKIYRVKQ
jgi:4-amino-4-deoxy-L-arabinose transferase-like glycosyltransferase